MNKGLSLKSNCFDILRQYVKSKIQKKKAYKRQKASQALFTLRAGFPKIYTMKKKANLYVPFFCIAFLCILLQSAFSAVKVSERRQKLITLALQFQGTKYVYGGKEPAQGFDCSGYVTYVVRTAAGIQLPRSANAIYHSDKVKKIQPSEREPGDLMFFKNDMSAERITHVGIYCGVYHGPVKKFEGRRVFISAVSDGPKTGVQLTLIDERFWKNHFFAYGRILPRTTEK